MSKWLKPDSSTGHPVGQSGQEVLRPQPAVRQHHRRLRPPPNYPLHRRRYLSGCPQELSVPPRSRRLGSAPVRPLRRPPCCLQRRAVVGSSSQSVGAAAGTSAGQHLPAPGTLPHIGGRPGPDPRPGAPPGLPPSQCAAEVRQQPRRTQPEDHVGLGRGPGLGPDPTGLDWC